LTDPFPEWFPRAPPMSPEEVEFLDDPATRIFVAVVFSFWVSLGWLRGWRDWICG
jgi:hypothetical protein